MVFGHVMEELLRQDPFLQIQAKIDNSSKAHIMKSTYWD